LHDNGGREYFIIDVRRIAALAAALALAGCSLTPVQPPAAPVLSTQWKSAQPEPGFLSTEHARRWEAGEWWALFDDPVLNELVQRANAANQTVAAAVANVAQAQAALASQRASLFPTLGASVNAQRSGGDDRQAAGSAAANLNASWAPDFWGKLRESVRAQSASVQASQADLAAARLSVQGALANAYFAVREADVELALLDETIAGYERSATITQNRYDVGTAARTDALQAQATLANARASRVALQRTREGQVNAIALLLGTTPADFSLPRTEWNQALPDVPAQLPSTLLLRRPDVASAERAVTAANAQIGVARAAYFPDFSLSASVGGSAGNLSRLVSAPALAWSLGLSVAQSIFDAGARSAQVDAARAGYDAAVARYRQSALTAIGEVEDQLLALRTLAQQTQETRQGADIAQRVEQQQMNRYQAGLADYTEVVTAPASAISARRSVLRQQAVVALIQAVGGGWQADWDTAQQATP
jgi:NodT family efflux transporter outer membrane factor (OMF) lipoprotein